MAAPPGLEVLEAINVRVAPGTILIPDLAVVSTPGADRTVNEPADVVLVVEITSPGNAIVDRALKPQLYAQAGIPHYLRVDHGEDGPSAVLCQLKRDSYLEVARADPGHLLVLTEPISVTLEPGSPVLGDPSAPLRSSVSKSPRRIGYSAFSSHDPPPSAHRVLSGVDLGTLGFALAARLVSALNPCGFVMLLS